MPGFNLVAFIAVMILMTKSFSAKQSLIRKAFILVIPDLNLDSQFAQFQSFGHSKLY